MRVIALVAVGLLFWVCGGVPVEAQLKQPKKSATTAETVRYVQISSESGDFLNIDGFLKETLRGTIVVSATLDVCHSVSRSSERRDRFVVDLKPEAGKLVGTGKSQEDGLPISVSLVRTVGPDGVTLEGSIKRGPIEMKFSSADNNVIDEKTFKESEDSGLEIVENPANFINVSPASIAVKVSRGSLPGLVNILKRENVEINFNSLIHDCAVLRSGSLTVRLDVDPERSQTLVAKLKSVPGVTMVGWDMGSYNINSAVLAPAAAWLTGDGKIDRDKLASAIGIAAEKTFGGKLISKKWDTATGELLLMLKRSAQEVPGLELSEYLKIPALVAFERFGSRSNLLVWVGGITSETVDEGSEPHIKFTGADRGHDEGGAIDDKDLLAAIVRDLKGRAWDPDKETWK